MKPREQTSCLWRRRRARHVTVEVPGPGPSSRARGRGSIPGDPAHPAGADRRNWPTLPGRPHGAPDRLSAAARPGRRRPGRGRWGASSCPGAGAITHHRPALCRSSTGRLPPGPTRRPRPPFASSSRATTPSSPGRGRRVCDCWSAIRLDVAVPLHNIGSRSARRRAARLARAGAAAPRRALAADRRRGPPGVAAAGAHVHHPNTLGAAVVRASALDAWRAGPCHGRRRMPDRVRVAAPGARPSRPRRAVRGPAAHGVADPARARGGGAHLQPRAAVPVRRRRRRPGGGSRSCSTRDALNDLGYRRRSPKSAHRQLPHKFRSRSAPLALTPRARPGRSRSASAGPVASPPWSWPYARSRPAGSPRPSASGARTSARSPGGRTARISSSAPTTAHRTCPSSPTTSRSRGPCPSLRWVRDTAETDPECTPSGT